MLFNSHGGNNNLLEILCRKIRIQFDVLCLTTTWFGLISDYLNELFPEKEINEGIHAGAVETSMMLHINKKLVSTEHYQNKKLECDISLPLENSNIYFGWKIQDLNKSGAIGNCFLSSENKGKKMIEKIRSKLISLLSKIEKK